MWWFEGLIILNLISDLVQKDEVILTLRPNRYQCHTKDFARALLRSPPTPLQSNRLFKTTCWAHPYWRTNRYNAHYAFRSVVSLLAISLSDFVIKLKHLHIRSVWVILFQLCQVIFYWIINMPVEMGLSWNDFYSGWNLVLAFNIVCFSSIELVRTKLKNFQRHKSCGNFSSFSGNRYQCSDFF